MGLRIDPRVRYLINKVRDERNDEYHLNLEERREVDERKERKLQEEKSIRSKVDDQKSRTQQSHQKKSRTQEASHAAKEKSNAQTYQMITPTFKL